MEIEEIISQMLIEMYFLFNMLYLKKKKEGKGEKKEPVQPGLVNNF